MKRNAAPIVAAVLAALGLTAALAAAAPGGGADATVVGERYDVSLSLPPGWHAARHRLVTKLLMPREVISVGTFGMAPGSGGNCGREPAASIRRMRPGDALVSIQEYAVHGGIESNFDSDPRLGRPVRLGGAYPGGVSGAPVYTETIPFRDSGRAFDALVYFRGRPSQAERAEVNEILGSFRA